MSNQIDLEKAKKLHKKAYLRGALTQFTIGGKKAEEAKPLLEKLSKVYDSAVTKRVAFKEAVLGTPAQ